MRSILSFFSLYGRARRRTYGLFVLVASPLFLMFIAAILVRGVQVLDKDPVAQQMRSDPDFGPVLATLDGIPHGEVGWAMRITAMVALLLCIAWVPLCVRRLHDMKATGWLILVFIAIVFVTSVFGYALINLALALWPGSKGANRYGPNPRGQGDLAEVFGQGPPDTTRLST